LLTEQAPVPTNVTLSGNTLKWDNSDYALLWAVCKDDSVVAFTSEPNFTLTENGIYSVRAANEMGGLSMPSATVTVDGLSSISSVRVNPTNAAGLYDLSGRKVQGQPSRKGIYIMTGKKVVK
jgi:hypothetical protein